jgi:uncharacterized protein YdhG (YjbR/CyaY superfamily)
MTVDEYLDRAPEPHASTLRQVRATLRRILPEATEELSYGAPSFKVAGKAVAGYAYHANHRSYLPHSGTVLESMADHLAPYERTKGSLSFPVDEALPDALVSRLVEARLAELGLAEG